MQKASLQTDPHIPAWLAAPPELVLKSGQVDVWRAWLDLPDVSPKRLETYLSEDELKRAARFHFKSDRNRFIAAHACLRDALSHYLDQAPGQLSFFQGPYGKPGIVGISGGQKLAFNLSHSHSLGLVAVTLGARVGVDVERIRPGVPVQAIARRFFSPREIDELLALPSEIQETAFFNCWTRKEAYIKARGRGLSLPLDSFDVSLAPGERVALRENRHDSRETTCWTMQHLEAGPGYAAALAIEGQALDVRLWDWRIQ